MLEITDISNQKNKNKFNLFVDGEFYCGINKETAIANNFYVGKKISKTQLDSIIIESESKMAFMKASDLLSTRLHSRYELKTKLQNRGFSLESIKICLNKLEEYGYINDLEFAKLYVNSSTKQSKLMISNKLRSLGINQNIVDQVIADINGDEEFETAVILTEKYLKNKEISDCKLKLFAYLNRKGFNSETIKKAIKKVTGVEEDIS